MLLQPSPRPQGTLAHCRLTLLSPLLHLQDVRHKREMQAQLGSLLEQQLELKEEVEAEEAATRRREEEHIKVAWHQAQAAAAAAAQEDRARRQQAAEATLAANRCAEGGWRASVEVPACLPHHQKPCCPPGRRMQAMEG